MLKIWGRMSSINVRKVVWAAQELELDIQRTDAGGPFGGVGTPEFLAMNPNAMVPVLDDAGYVLWESNAIVRYLCAKHSPGTLYPDSLAQRFQAEQWMDWQQTTLNPAGRHAFLQLIRTPADKRDAELLAQSNAATEPLLALLNTHLAQSPYMVGPHFSMADIPVACEVHRWWGLPQPRQPHPHLQLWYAQVSSRPAARGVLDQPLS